jgi:hypothetical protein
LRSGQRQDLGAQLDHATGSLEAAVSYLEQLREEKLPALAEALEART